MQYLLKVLFSVLNSFLGEAGGGRRNSFQKKSLGEEVERRICLAEQGDSETL